MLILGSTILVPPGNQGCAQKLHKKVKFKKKYLYLLLYVNPGGKIIQKLEYGDHDTVTQICVEFLIPGRRFMH